MREVEVLAIMELATHLFLAVAVAVVLVLAVTTLLLHTELQA
jgi:hypothetical protein